MKKHNPLLIMLIILLCYTFIYDYSLCKKHYQEEVKLYNQNIASCEKNLDKYQQVNPNFTCSNIKKEDYLGKSYDVYYDNLSYGKPYLSILIIFLIPFIAITPICSFFKNKQLKNILTRTTYSKIKLKLLLKSFIPVLIYTIFHVICIIVAYHYNGSFLANRTNEPVTSIYISLGKITAALILTNIGLCSARYIHNNIKAFIITILSYASIYGVFLGINNFLRYVKGFKYYYIFSIPEYTDGIEYLPVPLTLIIITAIIIVVAYHNVESLIMDCDNNE